MQAKLGDFVVHADFEKMKNDLRNLAEQVNYNKEDVDELKKEVEKSGSELALIHFGGPHQYRNFPALPLKQFDAFLESNGIVHFNAFDLFIKIDDEFLPENFIPNDGHYSEKGHRHFAEFSTDFLLRLIEKIKL